MERIEWIKLRRHLTEKRMDTIYAPIYDDEWGSYTNETHQVMLERFLGLCSPGSIILDAACGTGKYWPLIRERGYSVVGIDQSQGMLNRAQAKHPDVPVRRVGLQELDYTDAFSSIVCIDAMEYIFPEDWPLVLDNFYNALQAAGYLYFTIELAVFAEIAQSFAAARTQGLPVIIGEVAHTDGYHYYPAIEEVREMVTEADFAIRYEGVGDDYHHFIVQKG